MSNLNQRSPSRSPTGKNNLVYQDNLGPEPDANNEDFWGASESNNKQQNRQVAIPKSLVKMDEVVGSSKINFQSLVPSDQDYLMEKQSIYNGVQKIQKNQEKNFQKIFSFYASQHVQTQKSYKLTFDQIDLQHKVILPADYLKFCKDFKMPLSKIQQTEIVRKKSIRNGNKPIDFELFQEIIKEQLFVKETIDKVQVKEKELKILQESKLLWSNEQVDQVLNYINILKNQKRDVQKDEYYLWLAHQILKTNDKNYIEQQFKSMRIPFQDGVDRGQKIEEFSHQQYDLKNKRLVPLPKMGARMEDKYYTIADQYFSKKETKKQIHEQKIKETQKLSVQQIQENRLRYEKMMAKFRKAKIEMNLAKRNNSVDRNEHFSDQFSQNLSSLSKSSIRKKKKKLAQNFSELGRIKDISNHLGEIQRTSWSDLRSLSFKKNEEQDIKNIIGIQIPKQLTYNSSLLIGNNQLKNLQSQNNSDDQLLQSHKQLKNQNFSQLRQLQPSQIQSQNLSIYDKISNNLSNEITLDPRQYNNYKGSQMLIKQNDLDIEQYGNDDKQFIQNYNQNSHVFQKNLYYQQQNNQQRNIFKSDQKIQKNSQQNMLSQNFQKMNVLQRQNQINSYEYDNQSLNDDKQMINARNKFYDPYIQKNSQNKDLKNQIKSRVGSMSHIGSSIIQKN